MIHKFAPESPVKFKGNGDNALATLYHVNEVIRQVNDRIYYRPFDFFLTQSAQDAPDMTIVMDGECDAHCNLQADDCPCSEFRTEANSLVESTSRTGAGVYRINWNITNKSLINRGYSIFVEPLADENIKVVVDKSNARYVIIKTYNTDTAAFVDGALDNTGFSMRFYTTA